VRNYVSLAPQWHGTGGDDTLAKSMAVFGPNQDAGAAVCRACSQMWTGDARGVAVSGANYTNIVTKYDQLVRSYPSGIVPQLEQGAQIGTSAGGTHSPLRTSSRGR
jgi:triacylglycerol lipase